MKPLHVSIFTLVLAALSPASHAAAPSPYAGEESRNIKALSKEEIQGYEAGKGMGFAKSAELNGYLGPSHVLALSRDLHLSAEQQRQTQALFESMETKAIDAGRKLIAAERDLDQLFAQNAITPALLTQSMQRIGQLQATLRLVHLETHLAQVALLSPQQVLRYTELRGYGSVAPARAGPATPRHH